jgi:hypothetical protein
MQSNTHGAKNQDGSKEKMACDNAKHLLSTIGEKGAQGCRINFPKCRYFQFERLLNCVFPHRGFMKNALPTTKKTTGSQLGHPGTRLNRKTLPQKNT